MPTLARTRITITLPTFAVFVLRERAKNERVSVSAVVEPLILEGIMLDEVERLIKLSPGFARVATDWMRSAVARKKP
jgi:hypothetical protein